MKDWQKVCWRFRNAILTFGAESPLGKLGTFVSPVLLIGVALVLCSFFVAATIGDFGPCGPTSIWGWSWFVGLMIGLLASLIGIILSAIRTVRYLWLHMSHKHSDKI
jgi:hypothetical protein